MNNEEQEQINLIQAEKELKETPFFYIVQLLFIHPHYGLFLSAGSQKWLRALVCLIALALVGGTIKSAFVFPSIMSDTKEIIAFVSEQLGEISFKDSRLSWKNELILPVTKKISKFHVSLAESSEFENDLHINDALVEKGIRISPSGVIYWIKDARRADGIYSVTIINEKMFAALEKKRLALAAPEYFNLPGLLEQANFIFILLFPVLSVSFALSMLGTVILFWIFFSFLLYLRRTSNSIKTACVIALHCSIAPFFAALVYNLALPRFLSFENAYGIIFIVYIIFMIVEQKWFKNELREMHDITKLDS